MWSKLREEGKEDHHVGVGCSYGIGILYGNWYLLFILPLTTNVVVNVVVLLVDMLVF